jgi:hypothetical protein
MRRWLVDGHLHSGSTWSWVLSAVVRHLAPGKPPRPRTVLTRVCADWA